MKIAWKQVIMAFVAGALLGAAWTGRMMPSGSHGLMKNPEKFHNRMMQQFISRLKLTPDQQEKIAVILQDARVKMSALRDEVDPQFKEIKNFSRAQIRNMLTPEQQMKFDVIVAERDARFAKHRPAANL